MERIYLDYGSATPIDPRVLDFSKQYLEGIVGNPSSLYSLGLQAKKAMEESREKISGFINAENESAIIFTGSATESNNLAIQGCSLRNTDKGKQVAASAIEHISVLNPMKYLQKIGFRFSVVPVDSQGRIDLEQLEQVITKETIVTSIMYANNEIGTIDPIK